MDRIDEVILNRLQKGIPLNEDPFADLALELTIDFEEFKERYDSLYENGFISHTGPIYDTRRAGYRSTLMAMECVPDRLRDAAVIVGSYPGVSHCYERGDRFNLWSTLAVPPGDSLSSVTRKMIELSQGSICRALFLPEVRRYKLRVNLTLGKDENLSEKRDRGLNLVSEVHSFGEDDVRILRILQDGLPVIRYPFKALEEQKSLEKNSLFPSMIEHLNKGFIRRVSTILKHRKAGFGANGMALWSVPSGISDEVGVALADHSQVSHCYRRRISTEWPFSHYAMIHGKTRDEVVSIADELARTCHLSHTKILFSLKEFKKCRLKLYTEEYSKWPEGISEYVQH